MTVDEVRQRYSGRYYIPDDMGFAVEYNNRRKFTVYDIFMNVTVDTSAVQATGSFNVDKSGTMAVITTVTPALFSSFPYIAGDRMPLAGDALSQATGNHRREQARIAEEERRERDVAAAQIEFSAGLSSYREAIAAEEAGNYKRTFELYEKAKAGYAAANTISADFKSQQTGVTSASASSEISSIDRRCTVSFALTSQIEGTVLVNGKDSGFVPMDGQVTLSARVYSAEGETFVVAVRAGSGAEYPADTALFLKPGNSGRGAVMVNDPGLFISEEDFDVEQLRDNTINITGYNIREGRGM